MAVTIMSTKHTLLGSFCNMGNKVSFKTSMMNTGSLLLSSVICLLNFC